MNRTFLNRGAFAKRRSTPYFFTLRCRVHAPRGPPNRNLTLSKIKFQKSEEPKMVNKNSIYSLNKKNPDAIVYPSASGKPVFVTREDFPSEEDFLAFKKWSDEDFHEEEKLDHREATTSFQLTPFPMRLLPLLPSMSLWSGSVNGKKTVKRHPIWSSSLKTS